MIQIKYKTNAEKCVEANAKAYKRKSVYMKASQKRKVKPVQDIDFKMF